MPTDDKIRDENLQCVINREAAEYHYCHPKKLINTNILQVNKSFHLIKVE